MAVRASHQVRKPHGFTLVELLTVIAIIAVLISMLLPALSRAQEMARRVTCMSHQRQIAAAYMAYAADHDGQLVSAATFASGWVNGGNTLTNIQQGELYPYIPDVTTYQCPSDYNQLNVRSYSINDLLNSGENWVGQNPYINIHQIKHPTNTFLAIEEYDPRGYNEGGFAEYRSGDTWVDFPAHFHGDGNCISFMDGRVEYWRFSDPQTLQITWFFTTTPGDADLTWLQSQLGL